MAEVKMNKRQITAIVCVVLSLCCFVAHYLLMYVLVDMSAEVRFFVETFLPQLGNSGLVFTLLWYFGAPALSKMIEDRKKQIEHDIEECGKQKETAKRVYDEAMSKSANIAEEKKQIRNSYEASAEAEHKKIREEAELQATRMVADANASFELQASLARRNFEHELMNKAIEKARAEIVGRLASDSSLRDKLIDQSIATLDL